MNIPGFTAESSLVGSGRTYRGKPLYSSSESSSSLLVSISPSQFENMIGLGQAEDAMLIEEILTDESALEDLEGFAEAEDVGLTEEMIADELTLEVLDKAEMLYSEAQDEMGDLIEAIIEEDTN